LATRRGERVVYRKSLPPLNTRWEGKRGRPPPYRIGGKDRGLDTYSILFDRGGKGAFCASELGFFTEKKDKIRVKSLISSRRTREKKEAIREGVLLSDPRVGGKQLMLLIEKKKEE